MPNGTDVGRNAFDAVVFLVEALRLRVGALEERVASMESSAWRESGSLRLQASSEHERTLGEWIRRTRLERGLKQDELAAIVEVDQSTIAKWERGTRMDLDRIPNLARWMRVPPEDVVGAYYREWGDG